MYPDVLLLFAIAWLVRRDKPEASDAHIVVGVQFSGGLVAVSGPLGGEHVVRLRVGVSPGTHPGVLSSLSWELAGPGLMTTARKNDAWRRLNHRQNTILA